MHGHASVLAELNRVLTRKLTAINQYFLHARMYRNFGFEALNKHAYKASIYEMKHADAIIARILFLQGLPNLQELGKLWIGEEPAEMLQLDAKVQQADIDVIRSAISACEQAQDYVSRDLLTELLEQQEDYLDWLHTQLDLLQRLGAALYLQNQIHSE
jgi:bacterioferritin